MSDLYTNLSIRRMVKGDVEPTTFSELELNDEFRFGNLPYYHRYFTVFVKVSETDCRELATGDRYNFAGLAKLVYGDRV